MTLSQPDFTPVLNPHELLADVDPAVFELYRNGAVLHVWRNSSPHNWWLSTPDESEDELHHFEERTRPEKAYFAFARKGEVSQQRVTYGGWMRGGDEGMPVSETWLYDEAIYQALRQRWDLAVVCAASFNALAGSRKVAVRELESWERSIVRALKRGDRIPLAYYNAEGIEKLCAMSLAQVSPEGYATCTDLLKATVIVSEATIRKEQAAHSVG